MGTSEMFSRLRSKMLAIKYFLLRKTKKEQPSTKELLKQAAQQKKTLEQDETLQSTFKRVEKIQRKVLEENPEFMKELEMLKHSLGKDGNYDKAVLSNVLQKSREIYEKDPKMRLFLKQQEQAIQGNKELIECMHNLASMQQQVLQVS